MSAVIDLLKQGPKYLDNRRREMRAYIDFFAKQLSHIYTIMPFGGFLIDMKTGESERVIDPQWEVVINKLISKQQQYLQESFPEFYPKSNIQDK